jgi:hypothetical protein
MAGEGRPSTTWLRAAGEVLDGQLERGVPQHRAACMVTTTLA